MGKHTLITFNNKLLNVSSTVWVSKVFFTEATQTAQQARQAAQRAIQQKAEAEATEAAIRAQARYEAEATVRELQTQLWEKDSIIHGLQAEAEKLKQKISALKEYLQERSIFENFLSWFKSKNQQQSLDEREL